MQNLSYRNLWSYGLLLLISSVAFLAGCTMQPVSTTAVTSTPAITGLVDRQAGSTRLQPYLETMALVDPTDTVRVIVQYQGDSEGLSQQVRLAQGEIVNELALINALVIKVPVGALPSLAKQDSVRWIALDAPVRKSSATDGSALNVRDDFDQISFAGNNGAIPWAAPWSELGEVDGPGNGNVAVTSFWGGALQGLRLQGAQMGAARAVQLGAARDAHMGLAFRRKGFTATDYVVVELSTDGGATWHELTRFTGPTTDAEIQYTDHALSAYLADRVMVRLLTAPNMSADAAFYLDAIDIRPDYAADDLANGSQVYLPFVAGVGGTTGGIHVRDTRPKADVIADVQAAATCNYHCFNLDLLASTYVKAIRADKIWNVAPYIRGYGVTVAVVDSGISPHPDLNDYQGNSRVVAQVNFVPNSTVPDDFYGHGTHVAGTIAGLGTSSGGLYMGVAPEARLVDVKVTDDYGMGNTSDVVAGLQWIYNNRSTYNIKVANLSLNSTVPESYHVSALNAALEVLWFNKIVVVVSAGNEGKEKLYPPANDPFALVVGSMDDKGTNDISDDKLSTFSAYGMTVDGFNKPDLVAPGQNIVSLLASDDMNLKNILPLTSILQSNNKNLS